MKVLSGVYPHGAYEGEIVYEGEEAKFGSISDSEHVGIVIIHQELALIPNLSVAENIFLGNERRGAGGLIDWDRANSEASQLLAQVGLDENPATPVGQLGVGKQQLVEIAKALSKNVRLLILDEPTAAALNDTDSAHLLDLLRRLRDGGMTSIIISHKLNEIDAIADRTTILRDGRSIETLDMSDPASTQDRIIRGMVDATSPIVSPSACRSSERRCCGSRTGPCITRPSPDGSWSTMPPSPCVQERSWASPG